MYKTPSKNFVKQLKSIDKDLRVRWSYENNRWIIERKTPKVGIYLPIKYYKDEDGNLSYKILPEKSDRYIQYHDGYSGIYYCDSLDNRILEKLKMTDTWGIKNYGKYIEELEAKQKKKEEDKASEELRLQSREIWDYMNVRGYLNNL